MKPAVTQNAIIDPSRRAFLAAGATGLAALDKAGATPSTEPGMADTHAELGHG